MRDLFVNTRSKSERAVRHGATRARQFEAAFETRSQKQRPHGLCATGDVADARRGRRAGPRRNRHERLPGGPSASAQSKLN